MCRFDNVIKLSSAVKAVIKVNKGDKQLYFRGWNVTPVILLHVKLTAYLSFHALLTEPFVTKV